MKENILVFENKFELTSSIKRIFMATSFTITVGITATKETNDYNTVFPGALIPSTEVTRKEDRQTSNLA